MSNNKNKFERLFSTSGELRAFVEGDLKEDNSDVYPHTGMVEGEEPIKLLNMFEAMYDPSETPEMPHSFSETPLGEMITKGHATIKANRAIEEGNISQMKYITGIQDYSLDSSGIHALRKIRNRISNTSAYSAYVWGRMGSGKSDYCFLISELAKEELEYEIASNVKSFEQQDKYIPNYGELLKWFAEGNEIDDIFDIEREDLDIDASDKLFVFDEGSNYASGYSDDAYETQKKLGNLVKLIRKVGGNLVIVGHTGKDIHPDVIRLCKDCIHKVSKKTAEYYDSVQSEGRQIEGIDHKFTISGIPPTNYDFYTLEMSFWSWDKIPKSEKQEKGESVEEKKKSKEQRDLEIVTAVVDGKHPEIEPNKKGNITYEMIADHYDLTTGRVSQIVSKFAQEAE